MAGFQPKRGSTLLMPSGPSGNHLFVIVTDEVDGECLLVSLSTIREGRYHDGTCEVPPGVHEFVTDHSFAFYGHARVERAAHLVKMEEAGVFFAKGDMPAHVVEAICAGIEQSAHTPNFVVRFYKKYLRTLN
jgi:hypothetical protein